MPQSGWLYPLDPFSLSGLKFTQSAKESEALNNIRGAIIFSAWEGDSNAYYSLRKTGTRYY